MTTPPDSNVRAGRRRAIETAQRARRSRLARLLLAVSSVTSQLDRKPLPLSLAVSLMSACIIPVGPEWQDPAGAPNSPPQILNPDPTQGAEVTGTTSRVFQFTVTDQNLSDDLYLRLFVGDSPSSAHRAFITDKIPANGIQPISMPIMVTIACNDVIPSSLTRHFVLAAVADRQFQVSATAEHLLVEDDGKSDSVTWTLNLNCQTGPSP